jgi:hypothetical protein
MAKAGTSPACFRVHPEIMDFWMELSALSYQHSV